MSPSREPDIEPCVGSCENDRHKACEEQFSSSNINPNKRRINGSDECSDAVNPAETKNKKQKILLTIGSGVLAGLGVGLGAKKFHDAIAHSGSKFKRERVFLELIHFLAEASEKAEKKCSKE